MSLPDPLAAAAVLYGVANAAVFILYGIDKHRARTGDWRIPERVLLLAALVGPFGAWAGMHLFRHKTRKVSYQAAFWIVTALNIAVVAFLLHGGFALD